MITRLTVGPLAANCWIYSAGDGSAFVIDPGDDAEVIISALKKAGLSARYILLTHGHFDHIAAVPRLKEAFSPEAVIAIHRLDAEYLGPGSYENHRESARSAMGSDSIIDAYWPVFKEGLPPADILLEDGDTIGAFTVLSLPGHTPGSAAFWDREQRVIFTGDTLFKGGFGRTDLKGGDEEEIYKSLKRLSAMDGDIKVCPGHGGATTIAKELSDY